MIGILIITLSGLVLSILLVVVDSLLNKKVEKDYLSYLPGYNCGACGYGSCTGMNEAMKKDVECYKKCKPLRGENLKKMEEYINKK